MRTPWPVLLLLLLILPRWPAHAATSTLQTYVGGPFNIYINRPNVAENGFRIDCGPNRNDCFLLNKKACEPNALSLPISFTISRGQSGGIAGDNSTSRTAYAFLSLTSSCIFSQVAGQTGNNPNLLIGTTGSLLPGSVFYSNGIQPFVFSDHLTSFNAATTQAETTHQFTTREMLTALGLCSNANGVDTNLNTYYLCVGVDSSNKGGVNNGVNTGATSAPTTPSLTGSASTSTSSGSDPTAYLQLQIDTKPPDMPTALAVKPRNGRVEAQVSFDTAALDVDQISLAYTNDAANLAAGAATDANGRALGCRAWAGNVMQVGFNVRNQRDGSQSFDVSGLDNESTYGFCAKSSDLLGNVSEPTDVLLAIPRFECDLFSCYPGDLKTGYCGAAAGGQVWAGAALAAGLLALMRAVTQSARRRGQGLVPQGVRGGARGRTHGAAHGRTRGRGPKYRRCSSFLLALLTAGVASAALGTQASAQDLGGNNRPRSGPATDTFRSRPRDGDLEPLNATADDGRTPNIGFSDPDKERLRYGRSPVRPTRFNAEVRLTPYRPRVGSGRVQQVYDLVYRDKDRSIIHGRPLSYGLGFSWLPFNRLGMLGPYVRVAYWRASGATRQCTAADGSIVRCTADTVLASTRGNDVGSLTMAPITLGVAWHLDPLLEKLRLPIGVAVNFGLDYVLWAASSGGRPSRYGAHQARGATLGAHLGAQLSLRLDQLFRQRDTRTSKLAGTHLFAEYQASYGQALAGKNRAAHLDTTCQHLVSLGLGFRFF